MGEAAAILIENETINGSFINKSKRKDNFTMVTNKIFTANILSAPAVALYMLIAQKITIPGFILYKTTLRRSLKKPSGAPMGKRAFQTIWDELKSAGYLKQYRIRTPEGFVYQYELLEEPNHSRTSLINVRLREELVEEESGNYVVRSMTMARAEEESVATPEELRAVDTMDLVGEPKNIVIKKKLELTPEEVAYIKDYYEHPEKHYTGEMYLPDPKFIGNSPEIEWKKQQEARKLKQQTLLEKYMPGLEATAEINHIQEDDDRKIAEEILDAIKELVAPLDNKLIPIGGISWPQHDVLSMILGKFNSATLDRTIYQVKTYDKKIYNYKNFLKSTLFNNIRTSETWFSRNFNASYGGAGGQTDDDFMKIKRM